MSLSGSTTRFGRLAQALHWLTALLVLAAFLVSAGGPPERVYSTARASTLLLHESLGFSVLCLLVIRLVWRLFDRIPDAPAMPGWMELASKATHWALYALLFAVPATAMIGALFGGHPVTIYGLGAIGPFSGAWGAPLAEIHGTLGDIIMWLAGLHAAAAIFHHVFLRDRVLSQMVPGLPDPSSGQGG